MSNSENGSSLLREFLTTQIQSGELVELSRGAYDVDPVCGVIRKLKGNLIYIQVFKGTKLLNLVTVFFLSDLSAARSISPKTIIKKDTEGALTEAFDTLPNFKLNTIWKVATWAEKEFGGVNLYFEGIELDKSGRGKILKQDLDYILLQEFDSTGKIPMGKSVFERKYISRLEFGDIYF